MRELLTVVLRQRCSGRMDAVCRTGAVESSVVWSHACTLDDLCVPYVLPGQAVQQLDAGSGWTRRWTTTWKTGEADVVCPVRDLTSASMLLSVPVRRFSWRTGQQHRPGLECLVSTGRQHGFESLAERRLLLGLDFAGGVSEVLSQPFQLRFISEEGPGSHVPDFLALGRGAAWLVDVRPAERIKPEDELRFAAAAQAAASAGWRYIVVTGWRRHVMTGIDSLSVRRRNMTDRLGLQQQLLTGVRERPQRFVELVEGTSLPTVARTHAVHLLWHRRLAMDLGQPLKNATWIYPVAAHDG
ncbi:TnsA-like heteromeric transposase endonuclease subunit [Streptomyces sp. NPDC059479]|uniref:TnsA-like heteromeric transposase endonuclease subunit n=1 Tax=Streptomyces sp. NPDC059479 TaxID=3346848 RepID=UPI0036AB0C03